MSKEIDSRVVEMQFDNSQFESGVKESISTLDKLKAALRLKGSSEGLEEVSEAASNMPFDSLVSSVEKLEKRFSTFGIVGMRVIENITDSMMNFVGKTTSFVKSGIVSGGITRAMNLENAQFQLQGLLKDEEAVAAVMQNVNDAVDGTAYSLDAAAVVASQLAASGMTAGDNMYKSLRAVAGVAAMTNSEYSDIGQIFTTVAGNGKLMTEQLRQLSSRGLNAAATLAETLGTTEAEVREMVTAGKIDFQTFADAMDSAFGEHAKEANTTFTGALSNIKAALARIGAKFVSPLIEQNGVLVTLFNTIRERINEINTAIDPLANAFVDLASKMITALTTFVANTDFAAPFRTLSAAFDELDGKTLLFNGLKNIGESIVTVFKSMKEAWSEVFPSTSTNVFYDIIAGFHKLTTYMQISDTTADNVRRTFRNLLSVFGIAKDLITGVLKQAFEMLGSAIGNVDIDVWGLIANITDIIYRFREWLNENDRLANAIKKVADIIGSMAKIVSDAAKKIKEYINAFLSLPQVQGFIDSFKEKLLEMKDVGVNAIKGLKEGLEDGGKSIPEILINIGKKIIQTIKDILGIHSPSTEMHSVGQDTISGLVNGIKEGASRVTDAIGGIGEKILNAFKTMFGKITDFLKSIDLSTVVALGILTLLIYLAKKLADSISKLVAPLSGVSSVLKGFAEIEKSVAKFIKLKAFNEAAVGIRNIAIAVAIMAAALYLVSKIDTDKIVQSVGLIILVAAVIGALSFAISKMDKVQNVAFGKIALMLIAMASAIGYLVKAIKKLGEMDPDVLQQGFQGLLGILIPLAGLFTALGTINNIGSAEVITSAAKVLTKVGTSLLLIVAAVKILGGMDETELQKGTNALWTFTGIITVLIGIASYSKGDIDKAGTMILKVSAAMGIMAIVAKLIATMDWPDMAKAAVGMLGMLVIIGILTKIASAAKNAGKVGSTLLAMSGAMAILVIVAKMIASMEWADMGKAAVGMLGLVAIIGILTAIASHSKDSGKVAVTLLAMSVAIGILAAVAIALSLISVEGLIKGIAAVGFLALFVGLLLKATKDSQKCVGNLIVMAIAIGVMAAAVGILSQLDPAGLITATACLDSLMGMFALIIYSTKYAQKCTSTLIVITAVIAALSYCLYQLAGLPIAGTIASAASLSGMLLVMVAALKILSNIGDISNKVLVSLGIITAVIAALSYCLYQLAGLPIAGTIASAASLSGMLLVMVAALKILATVEQVSNDALTGIAVLTLVMAALAVILYALQGLPVESTIAVAASLSIMLLAMSAALVIMSTVKKVSNKALAAMYILVPVIALLGAVLYALQDLPVESTLAVATALSELLLAMSTSLVILANAGKLGFTAELAGIAGLAALIVAMGVLMAAIGALCDHFPKLQEFLDVGLVILGKIGQGIGDFVGGIVNGVLSGISGALPDIGTSLSTFMDNLSPFIEGAKTIDSSVVSGVVALAEAITVLSGAGLVEKVANFLGGGSLLEDFGKEIAAFAPYIGKFSESMGEVDGANLEGAANAMKAMGELMDILPSMGGKLGEAKSWAFGDKMDLSTFGEQIAKFAPSIKTFAEKVDGINADSVQPAVDAANLLIEMANSIPNEGGLWGWVAGENSLGDFGQQLADFAPHLKTFTEKVDGINADSVQPAVDASNLLIQMADSVPNIGGLISKITGDNSLSAFGEALKEYGTKLKEFLSDECTGGITAEAVQPIIDITNSLIGLANASPDKSKAKDLTDFSKELKDFGDDVKDFADKLKNVSTAKVKTTVTNLTTVVTFAKDIGSNNVTDALSKFGKGLASFGPDLQTFTTSISGITTNSVQPAIDATNALIGMANNVPNEGGWAAKILGDNLLSSFGDSLQSFGKSLSSFSKNVAGADLSGVDGMITAINKLGNLNVENLGGLASTLATAAQNGIDTFTNTISNASSQVQQSGMDMLGQFITGITDKTNDLTSAFTSLLDSCVTTIKGYWTSFYESGGYLVSGFATGISMHTYVATAAARKMASETKAAADNEMGIASPSKVFAKIGMYVVEGFAKGINKYTPEAENASAEMALATIKASKKVLEINSPSRAMAALGRYYGQGFAQGILDSAKAAVDASEEMTANVLAVAQMGYEDFKNYISDADAFDEITDAEKIMMYLTQLDMLTEGTDEYMEAQKELYSLTKEYGDDRNQNVLDWLESEREAGRITIEQQIEDLKKWQALFNEGSATFMEIAEQIAELESEWNENRFDEFSTYVDKRAWTLEEEVKAWQDAMEEFGPGGIHEDAELYAEAQENYFKAAYEASEEWIEKQDSLYDRLYGYQRMAARYGPGGEMEDKELYQQVIAAAEDLQEEINDINEDYYQERLEIQEDYLEQKAELEEEENEKSSEIAKELNENIKELNDAYDDALESRAQTLYDTYGLFDKVEEADEVTGAELFENLQGQVDAMEDWQSDMNELSEKGILSDELIDELREMGPSSAAQIKALNSLSDHELTEYADLWKEKYDLANEQAEYELEDMKEETKQQIAELRADAEAETEALANTYAEKLEELNQTTQQSLSELYDEWMDNLGLIKQDTTSDFTDIVNEGANTIGNEKKWSEIGANMVNGILKGMTETSTTLYESIEQMGDDLVARLKERLGIASPSKVFAEIGEYCMEGFSNGIDGFTSVVYDSTEKVTEGTLSRMSSLFDDISELSDDLEYTPIITPVVDMSEIQNGFNSMDTLFGLERSITLGADIGRINNDKDSPIRDLQNITESSNGKIVDSIDSLKEDISELASAIRDIKIFMDTGTLVGALSPEMDKSLGKIANLNRRGI